MQERALAQIDMENIFRSNMKVIAFLLFYVLFSTAAFYIIHGFISAPFCRCSISLTWLVAIISTTGVVVGIAVYTYMKKSIPGTRFSREDVQETVRFLPPDQRMIVEAIIEREGEISQSELPEATGLSKVKISRKLKDLERQGIVEREETGATNRVSFKEKFDDLLV